MTRRLLALDLDGTLLEPDGRIAPELVSRLTALSAEGQCVTFASGRPEDDIEAILSAAGVNAACGWPAMFVANERDVHWRNGEGFAAHVEWNDRLYRLERANVTAIREHLAAWLARQPDRAAFHRYDDEATEDRRAIVALCGPDLARIRAGQDELNRIFAAARLPVQVFHNRTILVFRHSDICKGRALQEGVRQLAIEPRDVLAIGDSDNDRGMLDGRYGFASACPGNAEPHVQAWVRGNGGFVATAPCGRGVLEILDHL